MALLTGKAIMTAFGDMLEEMPFDKITVAALVRRAGISSNAFYYHYSDIYVLLGAHSTDLEAPESAEHLCAKCEAYAACWKPQADALRQADHGAQA